MLTVAHPQTGAFPFFVPRGHNTVIPFALGWAFQGARTANMLSLLMAILVSFIGLLLIFNNLKSGKISDFFQKPWIRRLAPLGVGLLSFWIFYSFRVTPELNATFGDAAAYPGLILNGKINEASVLNDHFFILIRRMLDVFQVASSSVVAIQISTALFGGLFTASLYSLSSTISKNRFEKTSLFIGLLTGGYAVMLFGYIETTALELALMALFFTFCAKYIYL